MIKLKFLVKDEIKIEVHKWKLYETHKDFTEVKIGYARDVSRTQTKPPKR